LYQYSSAKANAAKMKSTVDRAKTDLGYAMIYSPIDGVVLNRAVDEGQTVAASFNTPTLFTIAQDLTKMQVVANVDEADIGQVQNGQKVIFTVDAFPGENFEGAITQIRLQPVTNANVVTYSVVISAPNPELKLKPGLTASITASTREADSVLVIPAKALRFKPDSAVLARYKLSHETGKRPVSTGSAYSATFSAAPMHNRQTLANKDFQSRRRVWLQTGDSIYPCIVTTGLTDEANVEIKSGLTKGEQVIISMQQANSKAVKNDNAATSSPFMPRRPRK
jgi:HlyD family secretion protein